MLLVSSLRDRDSTTSKNDNEEQMADIDLDDCFPDFSAGSCLLDSIDFDDIFAGMEEEDCGDELPDLDILGDYSISGTGDEQSSDDGGVYREEDEHEDGNYDVVSAGSVSSGLDAGSVCSQGEGVVEKVVEVDGKKGEKYVKVKKSTAKAGRSRNKGCDGKRKVKVDWTPELHKRFVQAVEQLGEKAVPSRILEIMGTEGLTRHNIASHLQKYRSHRKHLIAREVEAASWSQKRHFYSEARAGGAGKRVVSPWLLPTLGFPQPMPPPPEHHHLAMRPLLVWGHPSGDHSPTNMWPKHIVPHHLHPPALQPRPIWTPPPPYGPPSQGMPCFPPPTQVQRFVAPPVPGIPHQPLYKANPRATSGQAASLHPPPDTAPSSESVDMALEDVLAKPWLPLPIGLKPPAIDSVVVELQRNGVPHIPPS